MPAPDDGLGGITVTQERIDSNYLRSVNSFWCPVCQGGFQRPDLDANEGKTYSDWLYHCDHCQACGTKNQIKNSAFYAMRIEPRPCPIDNGLIIPAADQMRSDWWMVQSSKWQWRCIVCGFVGTLSEFQQAAEPDQDDYRAGMWGIELCLPE